MKQESEGKERRREEDCYGWKGGEEKDKVENT